MNFKSFGRLNAVAFLLLPSCASLQNVPPNVISQLRETISVTQLSSGSNGNITLALQACEMFEELFQDNDFLGASAEIRSLCHVLYASCLVRLGKDDTAVVQYGYALQNDLRSLLSKSNLREAILGRGRALQRLLHYEQARDQFLVLEDSEDAVCAAATCSLRLGDYKNAVCLLRDYLLAELREDSKEDAAAMLYALNSLSSHSTKECEISHATKSHFMIKWIACVLQNRNVGDSSLHLAVQLMDLIRTNISPFDEYHLVHLDDKVLLHNLLQSNNKMKTQHFWPFGLTTFVDNWEAFDEVRESLWVHKKRSGYGSHGNVVLMMDEARKLAPTLSGNSLLQRMVHPPLLLDGRKFSLRIYVIYFPSPPQKNREQPEAYVSKQGLLKLASLPTTSAESSVDMRVHMTNSGREPTMSQHDLEYLGEKFLSNGWSYDSLWKKITQVVQSTMSIYHSAVVLPGMMSDGQTQLRLSEAGIPKILGFDFVLDQNQNPWLIEINRFPGMEARDESDASVKRTVLLDAWILACQRHNLTSSERRAVFGELLEDQIERSSSCLGRIF